MEAYIYWSWPTMLLYISMGVIPSLLIKKASRIKHNKITTLRVARERITLFSNKTWLYFFAWFYMVFFATARLADGIYGGADSVGYIRDFLNSENLVPSFINALTIQNYREPGYMVLVKFIRFLIVDNQYVYFAVVYGFVAFIFLLFVSKFSK